MDVVDLVTPPRALQSTNTSTTDVVLSESSSTSETAVPWIKKRQSNELSTDPKRQRSSDSTGHTNATRGNADDTPLVTITPSTASQSTDTDDQSLLCEESLHSPFCQASTTELLTAENAFPVKDAVLPETPTIDDAFIGDLKQTGFKVPGPHRIDNPVQTWFTRELKQNGFCVPRPHRIDDLAQTEFKVPRPSGNTPISTEQVQDTQPSPDTVPPCAHITPSIAPRPIRVYPLRLSEESRFFAVRCFGFKAGAILQLSELSRIRGERPNFVFTSTGQKAGIKYPIKLPFDAQSKPRYLPSITHVMPVAVTEEYLVGCMAWLTHFWDPSYANRDRSRVYYCWETPRSNNPCRHGSFRHVIVSYIMLLRILENHNVVFFIEDTISVLFACYAFARASDGFDGLEHREAHAYLVEHCLSRADDILVQKSYHYTPLSIGASGSLFNRVCDFFDFQCPDDPVSAFMREVRFENGHSDFVWDVANPPDIDIYYTEVVSSVVCDCLCIDPIFFVGLFVPHEEACRRVNWKPDAAWSMVRDRLRIMCKSPLVTVGVCGGLVAYHINEVITQHKLPLVKFHFPCTKESDERLACQPKSHLLFPVNSGTGSCVISPRHECLDDTARVVDTSCAV